MLTPMEILLRRLKQSETPLYTVQGYIAEDGDDDSDMDMYHDRISAVVDDMPEIHLYGLYVETDNNGNDVLKISKKPLCDSKEVFFDDTQCVESADMLGESEMCKRCATSGNRKLICGKCITRFYGTRTTLQSPKVILKEPNISFDDIGWI